MEHNELTYAQRERYARNMVIDMVGEEGQQKLLSGKVLLIGAGGLGSPAALYLAAAGVGTIGIVDHDVVDLSNLQRQILHSTARLGIAKAMSAKERLQGLNPDVTVHAYEELATKETLADIIKDQDYDFVIDAVDNFEAKFLINDACVLLQKPFVHGGVLRMGGQTMTYVPGQGPCYRCIFEDVPPKGAVPTSKDVGILGAVAGTIGTIEAAEAIKYILGAGNLLTGRLLMYDALAMTFRTIAINPNTHCHVCGDHPSITSL